MKRIAFFFFAFFFLTMQEASSEDAVKVIPPAFDFSSFKKIPIMEEGRVKPMDTFARSTLLLLNGKSSLPEMTAISWLAEVLFNPELSYQRAVFHIPSVELLSQLNLPIRAKSRYAFLEFQRQLRDQSQNIAQLSQQPKESLTSTQTQLLQLHNKTAFYFELSRTMSLVWPIFSFRDPSLAEAIGWQSGRKYSYMEASPRSAKLQAVAKEIEKNADPAKKADLDKQVGEFLELLAEIDRFRDSKLFRVIHPQWGFDGFEWRSPWAVIQEGRGSPQTTELFLIWQNLARSYLQGDLSDWKLTAESLAKANENVPGSTTGKRWLEVTYNDLDPITNAFALYLLGFLLVLAGWMVRPQILRKLAFLAVGSGWTIHLLAVASRMTIMHRPPVTTLYESMLFVSLIAVLFGMILEYARKNLLGLLISSIIGSALLLTSFGYAAEGDTMGVLVAVLNTNFWLATHVVCITIGYGCCLVAGLLGHIYLLLGWLSPQSAQAKEVYKNSLGVSLVALFFSMFGTILGGIWADQSWGRFWGWDPKENGALWIVVWLLFLQHGRIAGILGNYSFALGLCFTNIIVALAWFGVNLLNVGLHSYGFTENIATNLALFCGGEFLVGLTLFHLASIGALKFALSSHNRLDPKLKPTTSS